MKCKKIKKLEKTYGTKNRVDVRKHTCRVSILQIATEQEFPQTIPFPKILSNPVEGLTFCKKYSRFCISPVSINSNLGDRHGRAQVYGGPSR